VTAVFRLIVTDSGLASEISGHVAEIVVFN